MALKEHASPHNRRYIAAQANYLDGAPKDAKKRKTARATIKKSFEERVKANKDRWFFTKLRF